MFGVIVSILSTYRTNSYCLRIFYFGFKDIKLFSTVDFFKACMERRMASPHSIRGHHYYIVFYVLFMFRLYGL